MEKVLWLLSTHQIKYYHLDKHTSITAIDLRYLFFLIVSYEFKPNRIYFEIRRWGERAHAQNKIAALYTHHLCLNREFCIVYRYLFLLKRAQPMWIIFNTKMEINRVRKPKCDLNMQVGIKKYAEIVWLHLKRIGISINRLLFACDLVPNKRLLGVDWLLWSTVNPNRQTKPWERNKNQKRFWTKR